MANERRLIDANALSRQMQEKADRMTTQGRYTPAQNYMFVATTVDNAPTVDAVEVVRCDKCKHYEEPYCMLCKSKIGASYWSKDMAYRKPDDFCSYGKKSGTQPQREDKT